MRGLTDVGFAAPVIVCNTEHRFLVLDQLEEIGVKPPAVSNEGSSSSARA
jgi:mannose-1-phosphate guanylyltransferase